MANISDKVTKMARILAIVHIIVGFLLLGIGIADLVVPYAVWGFFGYGIWTGVLVIIGGALGIPGTRKERTTPRNVFAGVFMGFSIASAVGAGIIMICYGISFAEQRENYRWANDRYQFHSNIDAQMALTPTIFSLGAVVFVIEIWAAVCLCLMKPCKCCYGDPPQQRGQVAYTANNGYVMSLITGGVPVAIPKEAGGGMAVKQGGQPQLVMVPVSGMEGYQPQLAQFQAGPAGTMDTSYQPLQVDMSPPYELKDSYDYNVML